jgi:hypothetical protein
MSSFSCNSACARKASSWAIQQTPSSGCLTSCANSGDERCKVFTEVTEECRLLRYKNPVRTSQETYYFSAAEPSRLMLSKIWGFHGGDYEECRLLGYRNPVRTSQETYYFSATEPSLLMLCKIWGFHRGDNEECRLLGYKNPVRTSQETHYCSAAEPSRLMLWKI